MNKIQVNNDEFRNKGLEKELRKLILNNGEYIVINQKSDFKNILHDNNNNNNNNISEIFVDFSDNEENKERNISNVESIKFKTDSLPIIGNNSFECSLDKNISNFTENLKSSQTNMNARIDDVFWRNKQQIEGGRQSSLFCVYQNKYQFHLTFWTANVHMKFIRHAERRITNEFCEKFSQPKSVYRFTNYIDRYSAKQFLTRKHYHLAEDKSFFWKKTSSENIVSVFDTFKPKKPGNKISQLKTTKIKSQLYLTYHEVTFVSFPSQMIIETMKHPIDYESKSSADLGDISIKNRGTILLKYKHDLILFTFDMTNISFEQVLLKTSRATQYIDMNSYIKYFSFPCNKTLHCPIPISTYKYKDPMVKAKYLRRQKAIYGISPSWMKEERKKRLKRFCRLKEMSESKKFELSYGSTIIFQNPYGSFCKIKCKIEPGVLIDGDYHYERMAMNFQRYQAAAKKKEKEIPFMTEIKHPNMEIFDNNLSLQDL